MKNLLSLPPNVVDCFHDITGVSKAEFFCTSDPVGHKLGSGGGTTWLLAAAHAAEAPDLSFADWLKREKRVLLHAGGQSRRLPAYAAMGKVLTPVPVFRWARGQRIDQCLLDLQLPLYHRLLNRAPAHTHTLIASGDVFIRTTVPLADVPEADVVCYGLWADPVQASHHGVFMMDRNSPGQLDFMLQKPSTDLQASLMQTHFSLIDIGVWLLSDRAVEALVRKSGGAEAGRMPDFYDLYSQFGCALGSHPTKPDADLEALTVAIVPLEGGEFYHFGTSAEMIGSSVAIQNLVKDQRYIIQRGVKRQSALFTQNAVIAHRPEAPQTDVWIENAELGEGWTLGSRHIITGVPQNDWTVTLRDGVCVDMVPIGSADYALRPYGFDDTFSGAIDRDTTQYLSGPLKDWMSRRGVTPADFSQTDDLQQAELFPVSASMDLLGRLLEWFVSDTPDPSLTQVWRECRRLSAEGISSTANLRRMAADRRRLGAKTLPTLARNWQKSVFYQVNLKDMAGKFAETALPLPEQLADDAPLMMRIHDAMFRSETERLLGKGDEAAGDEARAFGLLRQGLTAEVLRQKCQPHKTTFDDQIVWGRSAVRIDLAGGWTDTPPYSLLSGGNVVNVAIHLGGQQPLQVYVKPSKEPVIICRSIDLGAMERIETYDELRQYNKVGSPFSIPKAALTLAGFMPGFGVEPFASLRQQLEAFGCGIEITLLSAIPAGSGLGTSSILAATVLGVLSDFCGLAWDKNEICNRTLVLEQLLTTGGGWQDQYGGVFPGVKLLQTGTGFDQNAVVRWLPDTLFTDPELRPCHLLYYTGITRTAKHILAEIVRGMFLNNTTHLALLDEMKSHALQMREAMQTGCLADYGRLVRTTWQQNKALDSGTNPPAIEAICRQIDDFCLGYKLPGAGGGGFMYMVAKSPEAARRIRERLTDHPAAPGARFVEMSVSKEGLQVSRS